MLTTYGATQAAKQLLTNEAAAKPATWYLAAHSADPGLTGVSEVSGSNYARAGSLALTRADGTARNTALPVVFPVVTGAAYTVSHVALWDAPVGGNCLMHGALSSPKTLNVGDALAFAADELVLVLA